MMNMSRWEHFKLEWEWKWKDIAKDIVRFAFQLCILIVLPVIGAACYEYNKEVIAPMALGFGDVPKDDITRGMERQMIIYALMHPNWYAIPVSFCISFSISTIVIMHDAAGT